MGFPKLYPPGWGGDEPCVDAATRVVVALDDACATDRALAGGKAAALAIASAAGLNTLPGVVLTTAYPSDGNADAALIADVFARAGGARSALVARSSSVVEDTAESSMAGQFESVLDIRSVAELIAATDKVIASANGDPMAVLVQPFIEPAFGGVLFGVDPVSGRDDRRVISVVRGGPDQLVSGMVDGTRYVLDAHGRVVEEDIGRGGPHLRKRELRRLVALGERAAAVFGAPQDIEWAIGHDGRVWLLQSRPVTTEIKGTPSGPVYGPGPVAETFPDALSRLEEDLWVAPLREAVAEAVLLAGAARPSDVAASGVVISIGGRVAIDLALAGDMPRRRSNALHPIRAAASIRAAWRVGRLRAALPQLAEHLLDQTDADLARVERLDSLSPQQLVALLHRSHGVLRALHAHEMLMGMLVASDAASITGASVALRVLADARAKGIDDVAIVARNPVVFALTPPRIGTPAPLPPVSLRTLPTDDDNGGVDDPAILREALRLRARWVQELTARVSLALAARWFDDPEEIRFLTLAEVDAIAAGRAVPASVSPSAEVDRRVGPAPLPARFQLTEHRRVVEVIDTRPLGVGTGAGGGRGEGPVTHDAADPPDGSVLVTTTLSPGLGPVLPRLRGIVAETGSVLSHLAILAREFGVPTVVGYRDATREFAEGMYLRVDGDTGVVAGEDVVS